MADLDLTLPGDLPGLLRPGSPVVASDGVTGAVPGIGDDGEVSVGWMDWSMERGPLDKLGLRLDLSDPTGRVHAAWWYWRVRGVQAVDSLFLPVAPPDSLTCEEEDLLRTASLGRDMDAAEIITLRALCLRLAGRTP